MKRTTFISVFIIVSIILIQGLGCSKSSTSPSYSSSTPPPPGNTEPNTVMMASMAFSPASITIAKMSTVTWKNNDNMPHTSTSDAGSWDTGIITSGGSKTTMFSTAGTFTFHCNVHPMMTGTIIVQ